MSKIAGFRLMLISLALTLPFFAWACVRIEMSYKFDNGCDNHMQEAFSSPSLSKDIHYIVEQSDVARSYLETHNLTSGYSSLFSTGREDDIGVYYNDVVRRNNYLHALEDINKSDISNMVPETLTDLQEYAEIRNLTPARRVGTYSVPDGISIFPHNTLFFWWCIFSVFLATIGIMGMFVFFDEKSK